MASASTPSDNDPAKDLILIHTVQLIPMIKAQISGRMVSSGTNDVAISSVHSEKTRLKKLMKIIIGERSEPLSRVFNDQPRDIYIYGDVRPYVRF